MTREEEIRKRLQKKVVKDMLISSEQLLKEKIEEIECEIRDKKYSFNDVKLHLKLIELGKLSSRLIGIQEGKQSVLRQVDNLFLNVAKPYQWGKGKDKWIITKKQWNEIIEQEMK